MTTATFDFCHQQHRLWFAALESLPFSCWQKRMPSNSIPPACLVCALRQRKKVLAVVQPDKLPLVERYCVGTQAMAAGGTIFCEYNPGSRLSTLYSGWAFRCQLLGDGRRQMVGFLLLSDLIGLQQEPADGAMHGIEATTDVTLCVFLARGCVNLFRQHSRIGCEIACLSARAEGFVDNNPYRRLERIGLVTQDAGDQPACTEFPIHQQHIANTLSLPLAHSSQAPSRCLQKMGLAQPQKPPFSLAQHQGAGTFRASLRQASTTSRHDACRCAKARLTLPA